MKREGRDSHQDYSRNNNVRVKKHRGHSRSRSSSRGNGRRKDDQDHHHSSSRRDNRKYSRSPSYERDRNRNKDDRHGRSRDYDRKYNDNRNSSSYKDSKRHRDQRSNAPYEFSDSEAAGSKSYKSSSKQDKKGNNYNNKNDYKRRQRSNSRENNDSSDYEYSRFDYKRPNANDNGEGGKEEGKEKIVKEEPCFEPSGILAEFSNSVNGVTLKFTEPLDAAIPQQEWRLYPFKDNEELEPLKMRRQSVFLLGKDKRVADIQLDNPSCSAQHAVIQFREKFISRELSQAEMEASGTFQPFVTEAVVRPYIMDLGSTNKTYLNGDELEEARYYELREEDVLKFGQSTREYVLMKK